MIGSFDDADGDAVEELHRGIDGPVVRSDVASAEMIKLAANAALMTRISFINEIANVCEGNRADVVRVAEAGSTGGSAQLPPGRSATAAAASRRTRWR